MHRKPVPGWPSGRLFGTFNEPAADAMPYKPAILTPSQSARAGEIASSANIHFLNVPIAADTAFDFRRVSQ